MEADDIGEGVQSMDGEGVHERQSQAAWSGSGRNPGGILAEQDGSAEDTPKEVMGVGVSG